MPKERWSCADGNRCCRRRLIRYVTNPKSVDLCQDDVESVAFCQEIDWNQMKIDAARRTQFVRPCSSNFLAVVRNQIRTQQTQIAIAAAGRQTKWQNVRQNDSLVGVLNLEIFARHCAFCREATKSLNRIKFVWVC